MDITITCNKSNEEGVTINGPDWPTLRAFIDHYVGTAAAPVTLATPGVTSKPADPTPATADKTSSDKPAPSARAPRKTAEAAPKPEAKTEPKVEAKADPAADDSEDEPTNAELAGAHSKGDAATINDALKGAQKIRDVVDAFLTMGVKTSAEMVSLGEKWKVQIPALQNVANVKERIERACEVLGV